MAFFKTKIEREMKEQMEHDEYLQQFNEQIKNLRDKMQEYAKIAAQAELNGDMNTYDVAVNGMVELNGLISNLIQNKLNFDLIVLTNSINTNIALAVNALDAMANRKSNLPNLRKIQKTSIKIKKYMNDLKITSSAMTKIMSTSNPANRTRSPEEINSVRPMIEAERSRLLGGYTSDLGRGMSIPTAPAAKASAADFDLSRAIQEEKNRII